MLKYALIPFNTRPEEPEAFPEPAAEPSEEQVKQCQTIFDETEARRSRIEQKAQWAFTVIAFLVPFLASLLAFIFHDLASAPRSHVISLVFLFLSAVLLLLSFFSAARALSIRTAETLHLAAVVDPATGQFSDYKKSRHAQGLLYCSVINTAMNDHVAQLVKGAHVFTASGVIFFLCGAMPTGFALIGHKQPPTEATIVGPVALSSSDLAALSGEIARLAQTPVPPWMKGASDEEVVALERRTANLEAGLAKLQTGQPVPKPAHSSRKRGGRCKHAQSSSRANHACPVNR